MRIIPLVLLSLLGAAQLAFSETKYIPYVSQGSEWSTAFHVHNLCEESSSYEVAFKDSDGGPLEFTAYEKTWPGFYFRHMAPKGSGYVYFPPEGSRRHGYAEVVDDGDGCVATDVFYVNHFAGDKYRFVKGNPKPLSAPGVAVPFLYYEGCDNRVVVFAAGQDVTLEAVGVRGNVLGRAELENVFQQSFMLIEKIPGTDGEFGTLRVYGEATALGLQMCDYPALGEGPKQLVDVLSAHPLPDTVEDDPPPGEDAALPSDETFVIEAFATKLLAQESYGDHLQAGYSYRFTVRNPTSRRQNYSFTALFRDSDGFYVNSVLLDYAVIVSAKQTRTMEGTFKIYLIGNLSELTVELTVESYPAY